MRKRLPAHTYAHNKGNDFLYLKKCRTQQSLRFDIEILCYNGFGFTGTMPANKSATYRETSGRTENTSARPFLLFASISMAIFGENYPGIARNVIALRVEPGHNNNETNARAFVPDREQVTNAREVGRITPHSCNHITGFFPKIQSLKLVEKANRPAPTYRLPDGFFGIRTFTT